MPRRRFRRYRYEIFSLIQRNRFLSEDSRDTRRRNVLGFTSNPAGRPAIHLQHEATAKARPMSTSLPDYESAGCPVRRPITIAAQDGFDGVTSPLAQPALMTLLVVATDSHQQIMPCRLFLHNYQVFPLHNIHTTHICFCPEKTL